MLGLSYLQLYIYRFMEFLHKKSHSFDYSKFIFMWYCPFILFAPNNDFATKSRVYNPSLSD